MRKHIFALLVIGAGTLLRAQSSQPDATSQAMFQMEMLNRSVKEGSYDEARRAKAKQDVAWARVDFYGKASRFVDLWTSFAQEINTRQTFDARLAKRLSKAFHELEKSYGWPVK